MYRISFAKSMVKTLSTGNRITPFSDPKKWQKKVLLKAPTPWHHLTFLSLLSGKYMNTWIVRVFAWCYLQSFGDERFSCFSPVFASFLGLNFWDVCPWETPAVPCRFQLVQAANRRRALVFQAGPNRGVWWVGLEGGSMVDGFYYILLGDNNNLGINDLSRGHPKWWFSKGIFPKMAETFRLSVRSSPLRSGAGTHGKGNGLTSG